jgi:aldehyde:ferredoxin oxidoreductase
MLAAARGIEKLSDSSYLDMIGHRIFNLERVFNVREGFDRQQDTLPERILTEGLHTREASGEGQIVRNRDKFLDSYYQLRGWSHGGVPTPEKLKELGLDFALSDIAKG